MSFSSQVTRFGSSDSGPSGSALRLAFSRSLLVVLDKLGGLLSWLNVSPISPVLALIDDGIARECYSLISYKSRECRSSSIQRGGSAYAGTKAASANIHRANYYSVFLMWICKWTGYTYTTANPVCVSTAVKPKYETSTLSTDHFYH